MSDLGLGECGFGSDGFGWGAPATTNSSTASLLRQSDGTVGDVVKLDTKTGDYVLDANGNKVGWDSLSQRVYLALFTVLGSSAVATMGIDLPTGVITDDIATKNRNAVAAALKSLTDANLVELVDVITTLVGNSAVQLEVKWRDVSSGSIASVFI